MSKNLSELSGRKGWEQNLFNQMGEAAVEEGTPSREELARMADEFLIGSANTYGTATFYDFLKPENKNKKVYICNGTACLCARTQDKVYQKVAEHYSKDEIGHMTCLGRCHENSAFHIEGKNYSGKAIDAIDELMDLNNLDEYVVGTNVNRVLTQEFTSVDEYYKVLYQLLQTDQEDVLNEIKKSNLRGRGGAGFPIGLKLEFCRNQDSKIKFIICNADEGDPGAYSDRFLLEKRPHSVLFGMLVAGYVSGASNGILYIRAEYPESVESIQTAIEELRNKELIGKNILSSGFDFEFRIIHAQGSYICGEETALINSIEGQRPEVRVRPPYPAQEGLFNKPTVVNNVETLSALHFIIENGGDAWNDLGTGDSTGTKLVCLDSHFNHPGVYEVEMGTPLSEVVYDLGGGFKTSIKAMQIGGPLGGVVPISKIDKLTVDFESFQKNGFLLGHASIVCIPEEFPMMNYIDHLFDFAAFESCGKCFPCRLGTKRGHELTSKALEGDYKIDRKLLYDLLETLEKGSLCAHGGGIPLPIRNILQYFDDELNTYLN